MAFVNEANFIAATLLVISEIVRQRQDLKLSLFSGNFGSKGSDLKPATSTVKLDQAGSEDDDEERFIDVDKVQA